MAGNAVRERRETKGSPKNIYETYTTFIKNIRKRSPNIKYEGKKYYNAEAQKTFVKITKASQLVKKYNIKQDEFKKILGILEKFAALKVENKLNNEQLKRVDSAYNKMIEKLEEEGKIKKRELI